VVWGSEFVVDKSGPEVSGIGFLFSDQSSRFKI